MMRVTLLFFGALLLLLTGLLSTSRQADAQSAGRAFVTDYGDGLRVYRQWREGRGIRHMSHPLDGIISGGSLAWSPDGRWLAYINESLHLVRADGGQRIRLTDSQDLGPVWSPDGNALAFQSFREDNWDIYRIDLRNPTAPRHLTQHTSTDGAPAWSPDGEWIAFISWREGRPDVFRIRPDGSDLQNLTNSENIDEYSPNWSRDGRWIYFGVWGDRGHYERMHLDGSGRELVEGYGLRGVIFPNQIPPIDLAWRPVPLLLFGLVMLGMSWRQKP